MRSALLAVLFLAAPALAAEDITLIETDLDGVLKAVEAHKGKVVVVDVWGVFCVPCKEKFPHMVKLYNDNVKEGLVLISLTIDEPEDRTGALEFLKKQKATFQNFILKDKLRGEEAGDKKLVHSAPPVLHVFDRTGKLVKTLEGKKQGEQIDDIVKDLLKQK
jgi:thiol-disulfide isomerase/thioredoxin